MSTKVEGAEPAVILLTARATLTAGKACLTLTVTEDSGDLWRYNLSELGERRMAPASYGRLFAPDYMAALRRAAQLCLDGHKPGSTERGLLEAFAQDAQ